MAASYLQNKIRECDWALAFPVSGAASDNWFELKLINKCSAKGVTPLAPCPFFLLGVYIPPFPQHIAFMFVLAFPEEEAEAEAVGASFWMWVMVQWKKMTRSERWEKCLSLFKPKLIALFWRTKIKVYCECWWKERDCPVDWCWHDSWYPIGMWYVHWSSTCNGRQCLREARRFWHTDERDLLSV